MTRSVLALVAGLAAVGAQAQQPPAPPDFAPSNLTPAGVRALAATCASCHGTHGRPAPGSTLPGLAGKPRDEIATSMTRFREGKKPATVMHQLAKGYTAEEISALADHFSRLPR